MRIEDIIDKLGDFNFKVISKSENKMVKDLGERFESYLNILKELDSDIHNKGSLVSRAIMDSLKVYLEGDVYKSCNLIHNCISEYIDLLYIHDMDKDKHVNIYPNINEMLFKGRVVDWSTNLTRQDMLHIPFNKRSLINTQRFSIPGIPCIYLGSSLYIVWEELNRPKLEDFYISRFKFEPSINVLDLGLSILDLKQCNEITSKGDENYLAALKEERVLEKFLITNFFKMACTVKVMQNDRVFKVEYIVPQLTLMAVLDNAQIDGVRYPSVKLDNDSYIFSNYAFPAAPNTVLDKLDSNKGTEEKKTKLYSEELINKLELTQPINIQAYEMLRSQKIGRGQSENLYRNCTCFDIGEEYPTIYENTYFFKTEMEIVFDNKLQFSRVNNTEVSE